MFPENDKPKELNVDEEFSKIVKKIYDDAPRNDSVQQTLDFNKKEVAEKIKRLTYPQDWVSYNAAQTKEKIISEKLLLELLDSFDWKELSLKGGRPGYSLKERVYCMFVYTYNGYSSRRCVSDFKMAAERKILRGSPHFNTLLSYFANKSATPFLKRLIEITALPLKCIEQDFAVDATGFSTSRFERWFNVRTQSIEMKRHWKKCHAMIGTKSNIITSLTITEGTNADCPEFVPLVARTALFFEMREVSADKAYLSRENLSYIGGQGAIPYIPFKSNSLPNAKGSVIWSRMFDYFLNNKERFMHSYHKRSNVETTFSMIKRKFGNNIKTKKDHSQVNEILMKCLCHNLCVLVQESIELGIEIDFSLCAEKVLAHNQYA